MRKSLGSKRNELGEGDIAIITRCYGNFEVVDARELDKPVEQKSNRGRQSANSKVAAPKTFASKIFNYYEFGKKKIMSTIISTNTIIPMITDGRIELIRF